MKQYKHLLAASTAYFLWGFFSFGLKPISHYPPLTIMCYRLFLCVIILSIISIIFRKNKISVDIDLFKSFAPNQKRKVIFSLFGGAIILLFNWLGFIYVINEVNVQTAGLTYLICPILTAVLSALILKEHLSNKKWLAVGLSAIACILLSIGHFKEMYYAVLVGLAFAIYLIFQKKLNVFDSFNLLNIQTFIIAIILLSIFVFYVPPVAYDPVFYSYIVVIVAVFTIIPMYLNNFSLKKLPTSSAGILIYLNPIVNFLLAVFYFKETITTIQYLAYGIIILAIFIYNYDLINKKKELIHN